MEVIWVFANLTELGIKTPYGIGLMSLSPIIWKKTWEFRPQHICFFCEPVAKTSHPQRHFCVWLVLVCGSIFFFVAGVEDFLDVHRS